VTPTSEQAAELCYDRLFDLKPNCRGLFSRNMRKQGRMLMCMLNTAVASLDRLDFIISRLRGLGGRHVAYAVKDEDYAVVGDALL
jgi:hemoglobin-like flavoprotein